MIRSWMVIAGVTLLVALGANFITPGDRKWFKRLQRPRWLTFEAAIPVIWTVVFVCGAWSAYIIWENNPGSTRTWIYMGLYLLLEIVTVSYTPAMFRNRSLRLGTILGGTGFIIAVILAIAVLPISGWATLLLVPYLLWSPIGTYTTKVMERLNPQDI
ncbi:TspO/MBR family protein [Chlorogloeopsis fritschii PCC 9212]|jgi:translocator protein|uniref:Sensory protein TspO n=1 Tax=Chlorogloeopsis fritschii PCC 6912 TaxID=211165 RepID=A0A3S0XUF8_CHLFR|nr:TspO/MBR family protein [Chlorogloeopsis fritschii]MBF2006760.1 TspO/MBR family protein [Chlorogloeopsis fritschii C42_A2020_084]RUR77932.1 sensory protein TspO [Chlorogloeopsis fritschii PCC 6912]